MTIVDIALAVLAAMALSVLLTRIASHCLSLPCAPHDRESGRVRLVPLVLLAGLAALAWFCRDILFLIYIMLTGGFGH